MTPRAFAQRRRVLFTMLTTLGFRYPPGREPPVITGIRQYLGGWPGVGRIVAGMARASSTTSDSRAMGSLAGRRSSGVWRIGDEACPHAGTG